ncbi:MAG: tetratricopeptide repeat protein [Prevotella sp.]|nr:tetratricopeptide repeat protein [Prevotella sp.]
MQKKHLFMMSAASIMLLSSCSGKLGALSADNFSVVPNPLEANGGNVPATINGMFPEGYMQKKAVVTVTPELRYGNGQVARGESATFQGEKVEGNDQTIAYKVGGNYTMKTNFKYVPEMQKSELYLTFDAKVGNKQQEIPAIKVADGVISTGELGAATVEQATPSLSTDAFQRIIEKKQDANIKFLIQQANLRSSELKNNSVKEFVALLEKINKEKETLALKNVEVSAYASPDGGFDLNDKLAAKRQGNTETYVKQQLKKTNNSTDVDAKYTAQDWEGFQELVKVSNIQDKDVILRVLSMYKDPEEREQQIKNMSSVFRELADGILPQLRRARMTINYEVIGRSDDQIQEQFKSDAKQLSIEELLYNASLTNNAAEKENIYKTASQLYPNDARAFNNLSMLAYQRGDYSAAKSYAQKALNIDSNSADAKANLGLVALKEGDVAKAEQLISQASGASNIKEALGNLYIQQGKYAQAEQTLSNVNSNTAALAQILNKNYSAASSTLSNIKNPDSTTDYLKAVLNARQGNTTAAASALRDAISKDSKWADYASKDLELLNVSK